MLNSLVKWSDDSMFGKQLADIMSSFEDDFCTVNGPSFVRKDNHYEMAINVAPDASVKNVRVQLEGEKVVSISYYYETSNSSEAYALQETLPNDADSKTLKATIKDSKILVTVGLKPKEVLKKPEPKETEIPIDRT